MPESVTDRPTKSHEYVFLLSKCSRYWFDQEAVREPHNDKAGGIERFGRIGSNGGYVESERTQLGGVRSTAIAKGSQREYHPAGRNIRSVWEIATQPYPEAHFATFPEELARRCVLAGCPEWVCGVCGKPRERITEPSDGYRKRLGGPGWSEKDWLSSGQGKTKAEGYESVTAQYQTVGWSDCGHNNYRPGVVLDPFVGSGTVCDVARKHGRHSIGIDLNGDYLKLAARRLQQLSLLAETS